MCCDASAHVCIHSNFEVGSNVLPRPPTIRTVTRKTPTSWDLFLCLLSQLCRMTNIQVFSCRSTPTLACLLTGCFHHQTGAHLGIYCCPCSVVPTSFKYDPLWTLGALCLGDVVLLTYVEGQLNISLSVGVASLSAIFKCEQGALFLLI